MIMMAYPSGYATYHNYVITNSESKLTSRQYYEESHANYNPNITNCKN